MDKEDYTLTEEKLYKFIEDLSKAIIEDKTDYRRKLDFHIPLMGEGARKMLDDALNKEIKNFMTEEKQVSNKDNFTIAEHMQYQMLQDMFKSRMQIEVN